MSGTLLVALWGAILSTIAIAWDVSKWLRSGARLRITIHPNRYYVDSVREKPTADDPNRDNILRPSIQIDVVNTGKLATTLIDVSAKLQAPTRKFHRRDSKVAIIWGPPAIQAHFGKNLPIKLSPGEVWSGRLDQETVLEIRDTDSYRHFDFVVQVTAAHRHKPIEIVGFRAKNKFIGRSIVPTSTDRL